MPSLNAGLVIAQPTPQAFVDAIVRAEQRGVRKVWSTVGGLQPDAVTLFAAAASLTSRITLGTSVVPVYPRHPFALGTQVAALEGLAPGRFLIGIGTSHRPAMEGMFGIPMGKPLSYLREYLMVLRALLWEGAVEHSGDQFTVNGSLPETVTPPQTPLLLSALRANAFQAAGELSDGAISWVTPVPYLVNTALPNLRAGADAARRERPPLIAHIPAAISTDPGAAREAFRKQFALYGKLPYYANMLHDAGHPVDANGRMSDGAVDNLFVAGSEDQVAARLAELHAEGIDELLISFVAVRDAEAEESALSAVIAGA